MSIIVREKDKSEIILYSKGADSAIFDRLTLDEKNIFQESGFGGSTAASSEGDVRVQSGKGLARRKLSTRTDIGTLTSSHIDSYAKLGLRTLCMAKRVCCQYK